MHHHIRSITLAAGLIVASLVTSTAMLPAQAPATPTFSRDVAPILYKNCVSCHGIVNPLGFKVTSYRVDPEIVGGQ